MAGLDLRKKRWRILSIDGGGIYGYTAALWLRELCEKDPEFLSGDSVDVFAGCSSGAVNALLLAAEENPRDAVLGGKLEEFWQDPGTFSNSDPLGGALSYWGLTGWYGARDFLDLLERAFGDATLGSLRHKVFISCFDWHGLGHASTFEPVPRLPSAEDWSSWLERFRPGAPVWEPADDEQRYRRWQPYFFNNFVPDWTGHDDDEFAVVDVAYAAATPPGFRAMRGGVGDGATFNANPSADALAALVVHARDQAPDVDPQEVSGLVLPRTSVLSLGDGCRQPYTWWSHGDFGFRSFGMAPTNPATGAFLPPSAYSALQPGSENSELITRGLLGDRYFRINPGVMRVPTLTAAYVARWTPWREWILEHIRTGVRQDASQRSVDAAVRFTTDGPWT